MKDEITVREFTDISAMKANSAACVTPQGKMILTFHGEDPKLKSYLRVTDSSGRQYYVSKKKLANLLMGRRP